MLCPDTEEAYNRMANIPTRNHKYCTQTLDTILDIWMQFPELRLGQLLDNAIEWRDKNPDTNMFYVEDEHLLEALRAFKEELKK